MPAFPTNVKYDWRDLAEEPQSVIQRAPMERGVPKQRRLNSDIQVVVSVTVHFDTKAEAAAFETWFYTDIAAGQLFFDWPDPRTGTVYQARIVEGKLGAITYLHRVLEKSKRTFRLEYWRSTW